MNGLCLFAAILTQLPVYLVWLVGLIVGSEAPCQSWMRGRYPEYPAYMARTRSPHCCAVFVSPPLAHVPPQLLAALHPADQHPAGTPENSAPALNTSG